MSRFLSAIVLCLLSATQALAGFPKPFSQITDISKLSPRPEMGYVLLRVPIVAGAEKVEPILMRVHTDSEVAELRELAKKTELTRDDIAKALNVQSIDDVAPVYKAANEVTYLIEVRPGNFVIYGISDHRGASGVHTCFCYGTVGFAAKAGEITDIGYFYGDGIRQTSKIPEIEPESGYGSSIGLYHMAYGGTMRPPNASSSLPPGLTKLAMDVKPVKYYAVGRFLDPGAPLANRMVPIPGILAYEQGKVIDVQSGLAVPDNF